MLSDNSFPAWKYLRAIAKFVGTNRVDRLKQNVARGLASLDPVCRWADKCERVKGQGWGATVPPDALVALAKENSKHFRRNRVYGVTGMSPKEEASKRTNTSIFKQRLSLQYCRATWGSDIVLADIYSTRVECCISWHTLALF